MPLQSNTAPFEYYNLNTQQSVSFADLQKLYPGTSFPKEVQAFENWVAVYHAQRPEAGRYQIVQRNGVQQIENKWYVNYAVADMTAQESAAKDAAQAAATRADRNQRLANSDWTQLSDAPVDKTAWAAYRQALRDITAQAGFPWDVQWPDKPL